MAWTYDSTDLTTALNRVRLQIGDTDPADPQFEDEEIESFIDAATSENEAVIFCLRSLAARYARFTDKWVGNLKVLASQRHRAYLRQLEEATTAVTSGVTRVPSAGGIRQSQKSSYEGDVDRLGASLFRGMHDNKESV